MPRYPGDTMMDFDNSISLGEMVPSVAARNGTFQFQGGKYYANYRETGDDMYQFMDDFYGGLYNNYMAKSAGAAVWTQDSGYVNAIYGKQITAAMFMSDNIFTALGARPYNHEGVRIAPELATYGLNAQGQFEGLGADTVQDGIVPDSIRMPVDEMREPVKSLPIRWNYGFILQGVQGKDDAQAYSDYANKMAATYSNLADQTITYSVAGGMPMRNGVETSLQRISRMISSNEEIGLEEGGVTITAGMASPYGGLTSSRGTFYPIRSAGKSNYDSQLVNAKDEVLSINMMKALWRKCSVNWANSASPNNKIWCMGNITQDKLASLMLANNVLLNTVYVQKSFNGVKTIPGRDAGILLNSFQNVPIIQDGNINFDFTNKQVSATKSGDIFLLDLDHIWMSVLTPVQVFSCDNPAITGILQETNVMTSNMETRIDSFIQHGKIINLADEEIY